MGDGGEGSQELTVEIFGLVVDRKKVDVGVESGPLQLNVFLATICGISTNGESYNSDRDRFKDRSLFDQQI